MEVQVLGPDDRAAMPAPAEVQTLWFAAARLAPLNEGADRAAIYARVG